MGRPRKETTENQDNITDNSSKSDENKPILPEIEQKVEEIKEKEAIKEANIPEFVDTLPDKPLLRAFEVAEYFDVTERTVRLWIENGHLDAIQTPRGQWRITRESVDRCRFKKKVKEEEE